MTMRNWTECFGPFEGHRLRPGGPNGLARTMAFAIICVGLVHGGTARAEIAVDVQFGAPDTIFPNGGTTQGWQFSVNAPMEVTHLGLYDRMLNGFAADHPIGLWDEEGTLLAADMLSRSGSSFFHVRYIRDDIWKFIPGYSNLETIEGA